jgi:hypothetical protein
MCIKLRTVYPLSVFFCSSAQKCCVCLLQLITSEAMVQPRLFPCAGCNLYMNRDYRCSGCDRSIHWFCSEGDFEENERKGHGAHFNCLACWRGLTPPAAKKPSPPHKKKFNASPSRKSNLDASSSQQKTSGASPSKKKKWMHHHLSNRNQVLCHLRKKNWMHHHLSNRNQLLDHVRKKNRMHHHLSNRNQVLHHLVKKKSDASQKRSDASAPSRTNKNYASSSITKKLLGLHQNLQTNELSNVHMPRKRHCAILRNHRTEYNPAHC